MGCDHGPVQSRAWDREFLCYTPPAALKVTVDARHHHLLRLGGRSLQALHPRLLPPSLSSKLVPHPHLHPHGHRHLLRPHLHLPLPLPLQPHRPELGHHRQVRNLYQHRNNHDGPQHREHRHGRANPPAPDPSHHETQHAPRPADLRHPDFLLGYLRLRYRY